jgi:hypothetical protein
LPDDQHYHLLLETPDGNLSQIMRHINGAYTTYFNVKRKRAGHLFQGRYKAILVEFDEYAMELTRYIHLNPVRAGMVALPEEYIWSSYRSYIGLSPAPAWLRQEAILAYFGNSATNAKQRYWSFVEDLLGTAYESPLMKTFGTAVLQGTGSGHRVRLDMWAFAQAQGGKSKPTTTDPPKNCQPRDTRNFRNDQSGPAQ